MTEKTKYLNQSSKITATVLFDRNYVEPALVTALSLFEQEYFDEIVLIYSDSAESSGDEGVDQCLGAFLNCYGDACKIIRFNKFLPQFSKAHFTSAILYKLFVPMILGQSDGLIFNFDAGIILGRKAKSFFDETYHLTQESEAPIYAHQHKPSCYLHPDLAKNIGDRLYPAATLLVFDCNRYHGSGVNERFQLNLNAYQHLLFYADQELLLLSLSVRELGVLPRVEERFTPFLSATFYGWVRWTVRDLENCIYHKVVGSFKPWKYWVLDPNKASFLNYSKRLDDAFSLSTYGCIQSARWSGSESFLQQSLVLYSDFVRSSYIR